VLFALHELASNSATVLVANLVHSDSIVSTHERNNEITCLIIRLGAHQLSSEPQDVHVLLEDFLHVNLRSLGIERKHSVHRVLFSAVACVLGHRLVNKVGGRFLELHRSLDNAEILCVPCLCEIIAIVDKAIAAIHDKRVTTREILRLIEALCTERHARAVGENGGLGKLLSLQKHREGISATVLLSNLFDLDCAVGEEKVESVELVATVIARILPINGEGEYFAVILDE